MKTSLLWFSGLFAAAALWAQAPAGGVPGDAYSPEQLDQLLGPIALYPDPLVALILPAATFPSDITLAANFLAASGDPAGIDAQPWDPSVKGLARYPAVVQWLAANLDWTQALGAAFAQQPADVMKSIQQLRAKAVAIGTLADTPQQQVVMEGDDIRIVPAQPDTIYVPEYDPDVVYDVPSGYTGPYLTFGAGFPVGPWLGYECDWGGYGIWVAPWHPGWAYRANWGTPGTGGTRWHPDPNRVRPVVRNFYRPDAGPPHPRPLAGGPVAARPRAAPPRPAAAPERPAAAAPSSRPDYRGRIGAAPARPAPAPPRGAAFGSYSRGTETRASSARGQASRQAPVRSAPRPAPGRTAAPARAAAPARR